MNQTKIKYIKECLSIRRRRIEFQICKGPEPQEVIDAREVISEWEARYYRNRRHQMDQIADKFRELEEHLVLGEMDAEIMDVLSELNDWSPTIPID